MRLEMVLWREEAGTLYSGIAVKLRWYYSDVTMVLQWCYNVAGGGRYPVKDIVPKIDINGNNHFICFE
jgi:hypothetical protein